jgi:hypothetical protein
MAEALGIDAGALHHVLLLHVYSHIAAILPCYSDPFSEVEGGAPLAAFTLKSRRIAEAKAQERVGRRSDGESTKRRCGPGISSHYRRPRSFTQPSRTNAPGYCATCELRKGFEPWRRDALPS